jgi:hypothetical protein
MSYYAKINLKIHLLIGKGLEKFCIGLLLNEKMMYIWQVLLVKELEKIMV